MTNLSDENFSNSDVQNTVLKQTCDKRLGVLMMCHFVFLSLDLDLPSLTAAMDIRFCSASLWMSFWILLDLFSSSHYCVCVLSLIHI